MVHSAKTVGAGEFTELAKWGKAREGELQPPTHGTSAERQP